MLIVFGLFGGLAIFIYGIQHASEGLQKISGGKLKTFISRLTNNRFLGVFAGIIITILDQSSSATTVMLMSFATANIITLIQALGVILGAGIGTAIIVQLIAFNVYDYALLFVGIGFVTMFVGRNKFYVYTGRVVLGFGFVFLGMKIISSSVYPLRESAWFINALTGLQGSPLLGILVGTILAAVVQNSAAIIGLLLMLSMQGLAELSLAIPIILGANIGTCCTVLIGCISASREGKRVALAHILIKIIGVALFFVFLNPFISLVSFVGGSLPRQIANAHTVFNIAVTLLFLPVIPVFVKIINMIIPVRAEERPFGPLYLDNYILDMPALALLQAKREVLREGTIVLGMMGDVMEMFERKDLDFIEEMRKMDDKVDILNKSITLYLTRLSQRSLTQKESEEEVGLLYITNDIESIGDIIDKNITPIAKKMILKQLSYSYQGFQQLKDMHTKVTQNLAMVIKVVKNNDHVLAQSFVDRKIEIEILEDNLRMEHITRLNSGLRESIDTSNLHMDLIDQFKMINSHIARIARAFLDLYQPL